MSVKAYLKNLRVAPRKVRLIADLIRGKDIVAAQNILRFTIKNASLPVLQLLNSAVINAKNAKLNEKELYISKIFVDEGLKLRRTFPRARGRADVKEKKSSHVMIVLDEKKSAINLSSNKNNTIQSNQELDKNKTKNNLTK